MKPTFTPGPWRIMRSSDYTDNPDDTKIMCIEGANGKSVYYTDSGYFRPVEADARLIEAAPAMHALLLRAADSLQAYCADVNGDMNDALGMEIEALLDKIKE